MKYINLATIALLLLLSTSCKFLKKDGGSSVGNGINNSGQTFQINGTCYGVSHLSTLFFDVSDEAITSAKKQHKPKKEKGNHEKVLTGKKGGKAKISRIEDVSISADKFKIVFDQLNLREGIPMFKTGTVRTNLIYTPKTRAGTLKGLGIKISKYTIDFILKYNLEKIDQLWKGKMTGRIRIDGEEYIVNHDYDAPVLLNVRLNKKELYNGGEITGTIKVRSNSPIRFLDRVFSSQNKIIWGGGSQKCFTKIGKDLWQYTWKDNHSKYYASGQYSYSEIKVENEAHLSSYAWPTLYFHMFNNHKADRPIITSLDLSTTEITNGGTVDLIVTVKGKTPIDMLNASFDGPLGNIYGGGNGRTFKKISEDLWQLIETHNISEWAPSGVYTFSKISVENAGNIESPVFDRPLSFRVNNNHKEAETPQVENVYLDKNVVNKGEAVTLTIIARSNAPVDHLSSQLDGPLITIHGGGGQKDFEKKTDNFWKYSYTYYVSPHAPSGTYTFSRISVMNAGFKESSEWPSVSFEVR